MSKSISPPLSSKSVVSSGGGGGGVGNSFHSSASFSSSNIANNNMPPRPQIPPGYASPVRTPHAHDVLSGRGGRINSHAGNIRFRELVDAYKRKYLDPRTKKVEKARIAARIVNTIRTLDPKGKFLKEDPHTGLWVEIGDERAWKKAGQALRESAPEIRAERQAQLQMMAGVPASGVGGGSVGVSVLDSGGGGGGGAASRGFGGGATGSSPSTSAARHHDVIAFVVVIIRVCRRGIVHHLRGWFRNLLLFAKHQIQQFISAQEHVIRVLDIVIRNFLRGMVVTTDFSHVMT
mmetsp:Transcript_40304/g.86991  ORF Transcript_40304/g.86991 Transcript_40304/m.86991 type:complete len:291 (-) Transcript_40304:142-1014(-)